MKKMLAMFAGCLVVSGYLCLPTVADHHEKPKYSIKDVMKKGMNPKSGLLKKVQSGDASDDEKKLLADMLAALGENEPPKGDAESWKKKSKALAKAGKALVDGDENAMAMLKKASNCKSCHSEHKPG